MPAKKILNRIKELKPEMAEVKQFISKISSSLSKNPKKILPYPVMESGTRLLSRLELQNPASHDDIVAVASILHNLMENDLIKIFSAPFGNEKIDSDKIDELKEKIKDFRGLEYKSEEFFIYKERLFLGIFEIIEKGKGRLPADFIHEGRVIVTSGNANILPNNLIFLEMILGELEELNMVENSED